MLFASDFGGMFPLLVVYWLALPLLVSVPIAVVIGWWFSRRAGWICFPLIHVLAARAIPLIIFGAGS